MIYLVGVLCLLLMRLQDFNCIFDYLVPVYAILVILLVVGVIPSFTTDSPGDRKLYTLKKKQKQQPSAAAATTDNRHWKDCYDGKFLNFDCITLFSFICTLLILISTT